MRYEDPVSQNYEIRSGRPYVTWTVTALGFLAVGGAAALPHRVIPEDMIASVYCVGAIMGLGGLIKLIAEDVINERRVEKALKQEHFK